MGKLATMVLLWSWVNLGISLMASLLFLQTGCLYLTRVALVNAELQGNHTIYMDNRLDLETGSEDEDPLWSFEEEDEDDDEWWEESDNDINIKDYTSTGSSKVLKVKNGGGVKDSVNKKELEGLEKMFMGLFQMNSVPKKGPKHVRKELIDFYEKQSKGEIAENDGVLPGKLTRTGNTVRVLNPKDISFPDSQIGLHTILTFDISLPENEKITGAELRLRFSISKESLSSSPSSSPVFARVLLHDIVRSARQISPKNPVKPSTFWANPMNHPISQVIDSKLVHLTKRKSPNFWLKFDLLPAILRWTTSASGRGSPKNHSVALEIVGLKGETPQELQRRQNFQMKLNTELEDSSSLFIYSDDGHNSFTKQRIRRDAGDDRVNKPMKKPSKRSPSRRSRSQQRRGKKSRNRNRNRKPHRHKNSRRNLCSRKEMFVDFQDVGWNSWIVAPPGFQAFYCSGECPYPMAEHLNGTNHAVMQALVNSINPSLVPSPCCVPTSYSSFSLLYYDTEERIMLRNYNEMVVESCGCS